MDSSKEVATIIEALRAQAAKILAAAHSTSELKPFNVTSKGNFPYYWQNPANLKFNTKTYDWINRNLKANTSPVQLDEPFTNLFIKALSSISYKLSDADQVSLNAAAANATDQQMALLTNWTQAFGSITPETGLQPIDIILNKICTTWASTGPTTLMAIQNAPDLNDLLDKTPAAGKPILNILSNYLDKLNAAISLQNASSNNNGYLRRALKNLQGPSATNGGLTTDDDTVHPDYKVSSPLNSIINELKSENHITVTMGVSRANSSTYRVTINQGASIEIPFASFFRLNFQQNASYFEERIATNATSISIAMKFTGLNVVNFGPTAFDESTNKNWYFLQPIRDAIQNKGKDVSGYHFTPDPGIDFTKSGPFGHLVGVAISNYPSVSITIISSQYESIHNEFSQHASAGVTFLGIPLGIGGSESTYSASSKVDASTQTITIELNPPAELVAGARVDSMGWVLGVQTTYPAA